MNTTHLSILIGSMLIASGPVLAEVPWWEPCLTVERNPKSCLIHVHGDNLSAKKVNGAPECHRTWQEACVMVGFPLAPENQVTPDNAFQYPFNRWALQNVNRFTRTTSMLTGREEVYPIPEKIDANLLNWTLPLNGRRYTIAEYAKRSFTDALVVVKNGKIITEWYDNGMSAYKAHYAASITKSVTGLLAEILIEQGTLNENKLVRSYVPELARSPFGDVTVRDILDMKVNVGKSETSGKGDDATAALWSTLELNSDQSLYKTLTKVKADGRNDGVFHYASLTAEVAGWIITRAAKKPYEQLASDLLWSKLGLQDDIYIAVDPAGKVFSSAGMAISARDLAKLGLMVINYGEVKGRQAFPRSVIDRLYTYGDANAWRNGTFGNPEVRSYRSYFYQLDGEEHALDGEGVYGQFLYMNPASNLVTVRFSSEPAQEVKEYEKGWKKIYVRLDESAKVPR
jgi:CubicO group peptidase (beta-lactamase class C family)